MEYILYNDKNIMITKKDIGYNINIDKESFFMTEKEFNGLAETQRTELHLKIRMYYVELMKSLEKVELDVKDLGLTISQARSSKLRNDLIKSLEEVASLRTK